jgi:hypothetical protein
VAVAEDFLEEREAQGELGAVELEDLQALPELLGE